MNAAEAAKVVESLHAWSAFELAEVSRRIKGQPWAERALRAEADLREVVAESDALDDDTLFAAYWAVLEHFGERLADESVELTLKWVQNCILDGWCDGSILARLQQCQRMETLSQTVAIGLRSDHTREGPAVRCSGVTSPSPGPWLDISRLDLLEYQRMRVSDEQAQPTDAQRREQDRVDARARVERLIDAYHALFGLLTQAEMLERFVRHRVRVTISAQDGNPYENSGVSFMTRAMDIEDARVERAFETARELAYEFAPSLRERLLALPVTTLVQVRDWWNTPNPLTEACPGPLEQACRPLGEAIARKIVHGVLVADSRPLLGGKTRAGDPSAHILVEAVRWPPSQFPGALDARREVISAASWGDYTWTTSGLASDHAALEALQARLKGDVGHGPARTRR